ncbi:hypothetical protein JVT61DRAFT_3922 [Boletus reticuloceps]|uniref:Uncharacterized protein n=1 Tax=Boletus reticuloceps TaxID=495285 RepID=A0A8I2YL92_9AGAM|nr:hypothetical protein JVT61DRAFT_3922 [Boletus reticuloceps]
MPSVTLTECPRYIAPPLTEFGRMFRFDSCYCLLFSQIYAVSFADLAIIDLSKAHTTTTQFRTTVHKGRARIPPVKHSHGVVSAFRHFCLLVCSSFHFQVISFGQMASSLSAHTVNTGNLVHLVCASNSSTVYPSDNAVVAVLNTRFRSDLTYSRTGTTNLLVVNAYTSANLHFF